MDLDKIDPGFVRDLLDSPPSVHAVARWIKRRNPTFIVYVKEIKVRPDPSQRAKYSDGCDIIVIDPATNRRWTVEVKQTKKSAFTCAEDYLHDTLIVNTASKVDRFLADVYFMVSRDCTHAAITLGKNRDQWWRMLIEAEEDEHKSDKEPKRNEPCYHTCLWQATWVDLRDPNTTPETGTH